MSIVKLGNGPILQAFISGQSFRPSCDCVGADVGIILSTLGMAGSNLHNLYPGERCAHGNPLKAGTVAYLVENYKEPAIKVKGRADIMGMLNNVMIGSVALVFFKTNGAHHAAALDLYLTNKLWINSGVAEESDEMWIWVMGGASPSLKQKKHHSKSHHKQVVVF